jgi:Domain of unknown function (DUF4232)
MDRNKSHRTQAVTAGRRRVTRATGRAAAMAAAAGLAVLAFTAAGSAATSARAGSAAHATLSASVPKCTAASLGVWVAADRGNGAAGTIYYPMEFTNISHHTCSLAGFPGVSAIDRHGHQLGPAAFRDHIVAPHTVTLAPGATAHATLAYVDAVVGTCPKPIRPAFELRVYPPDQVHATHAYWDLDVCTAKRFLGVTAIQAGAGS